MQPEQQSPGSLHPACSATVGPKCNIESAHVGMLLCWLGIPEEDIYPPRKPCGTGRWGKSGSFWKRDINHLMLLERAREQFRARIKAVHPDYGGDPKGTIETIRVWRIVRRRFQEHGYELWR